MTKQANRNPIKEQEEEQDKKKFNGKKGSQKSHFFQVFFFLSFVSGEKNYNNRRVEKERKDIKLTTCRELNYEREEIEKKHKVRGKKKCEED